MVWDSTCVGLRKVFCLVNVLLEIEIVVTRVFSGMKGGSQCFWWHVMQCNETREVKINVLEVGEVCCCELLVQ